MIGDAVESVVAKWPPLTDAQLDKVTALLRAGSRSRKTQRHDRSAA